MQYCPKCEMKIRGSKECCPLCQGLLSGKPEEAAFPQIAERKYNEVSLFKISTFALAVVEIILMSTGILNGFSKGLGMTMLIFLLIWGDLWITQYYHFNVLKMVTCEAYFIMLTCVIIDAELTDMIWSVEWVIPFIFLGLIILTFIIAAFMKLTLEEYVLYLLFDTLFALLQLIPVITGVNRHPIPAVVTTALTLILSAAVLIFRPQEFKTASGKWFSM